MAFCDGVRATLSGDRNDSSWWSRPCQPSQFHRPNTASRAPIPVSRAISDSTLHTTTLAAGVLATSFSGGQLLVYEYSLPGRSAAATHALHEK